MKTRKRSVLCLAGVFAAGLLAGCQPAHEPTTVTLLLSDAVYTREGQPRDVTLHLLRRQGRWAASFAIARRWNAATHAAEAAQLEWDRDANELQGRVFIALQPDAWIPRDHRARSLNVYIDAAIDGNAVRGSYSGVFQGREVSGELVGQLEPARTDQPGDRAGLLRTFLPNPDGGLTETVMRFVEEDGRVVQLAGATSSAHNLDMQIDADGLDGTCHLSYGDEDGPFSKPITAEFDLSFIDGRIGGAVFLKGHGGKSTPRQCSVSGWLERKANGDLANRTENTDPHDPKRRARIAEAQQAVRGLEKTFTAHVHKSGQAEQPYRLFTPKQAGRDRKLPLVVYLHGAGERGSDNRKQLNSWGKIFARPEVQKTHPCFVLAPHASNWYCGAPEGAPDGSPTHATLILQIVRKLRNDPRIDPQRIYVTGLSMGGFGTCELISRAPKLFAAGIPICGAIAEQADAIADTPLWVFHGDSDVTVHVSHSRDLVKALRDRGADPLYTEYPHVGHGSYKWAYTNPAMYDWLFARKRTDGE
jgi:poly(3-hydroxybutyrate) depolymerase